MIKVIALVGIPGVGKTFLFRELMGGLEWKVFRYNKLRFHKMKNKDVFILGLYPSNKTFAGTDMLSMNILSDVFSWFKVIESGIVLFEGDRLNNRKMYDFLSRERVGLEIIELLVSDRTLELNRKDRVQSQSFQKRIFTKINNIKEAYPVTSLGHDDCLKFFKMAIV